MNIDQLVQNIAIWALPVIFAITVHEVAHGWVAFKLGDNTAKAQGRLTLNPIKHIDPIGTLLVPVVLLALGGFLFGWAKPVPVNFGRLNRPKRDSGLVAIAGPAANFIMVFGWLMLMKLSVVLAGNSYAEPMRLMAIAGIQINLVLMFLNLLPILPLDGGRVLVSLLPVRMAYTFSKTEPYGMFVVIGLLVMGALPIILGPLIHGSMSLLSHLV